MATNEVELLTEPLDVRRGISAQWLRRMISIVLAVILLAVGAWLAIPKLRDLIPYHGGYLVLYTTKGFEALRTDNGRRVWVTPSSTNLGHGNLYTDGRHIITVTGTVIQVLDARTGRMLWHHAEANITGQTISTPLLLGVTSGTLFVEYIGNGPVKGYDSALLEAFDVATGTQRWQRTLPEFIGAILDGPQLFITYVENQEFYLQAEDAVTEVEHWNISGSGNQFHGFRIMQGLAIILSDMYRAYDEKTGTILWQEPVDNYYFFYYPSQTQDVLLSYSLGSQADFNQPFFLLARDPRTFRTLWQREIPQFNNAALVPPLGIITLTQDGTLQDINVQDGAIRWQIPFPDLTVDEPFATGDSGGSGSDYANIAAQGRFLYVDSQWSPQHYHAYAFMLSATASVKWQFDGALVTSETWNASTAMVQSDGHIFGIRNDRSLTALDPQTGALQWQMPTTSIGIIYDAVAVPNIA